MKAIYTMTLVVFFLSGTSFLNGVGWSSLLDRNLSKWEIYQSFSFKDGYKGEAPKDANGAALKPIGYNKNVGKLFTVFKQNNEIVLRISGEVYGCVFTKEVYENYHLKLMVRFGQKKWQPRLNESKDSGLLYHSQGRAGVDYWRSWMLAHEFQIAEGGYGDYWCVSGVGSHIKMNNPENNNMGIYDRNGILTGMGVSGTRNGFVQHSQNFEKEGEWNSIELICFGDKSIHIVNGHVVMAVSKSVYKYGNELRPLVRGKIQLQSEAAEVFYKNIMVKHIDRIPAQYAAYFD